MGTFHWSCVLDHFCEISLPGLLKMHPEKSAKWFAIRCFKTKEHIHFRESVEEYTKLRKLNSILRVFKSMFHGSFACTQSQV